MSGRAQTTLFGGNPEMIPIIRWRWNNGLLFMDYRDRVLHWINTHTVHEVDLEVNRIIGDALAFHQARDILNNDFEMLCESKVFSDFNPLTKEVLNNVKNSRLTLDREALRALSRGRKSEPNGSIRWNWKQETEKESTGSNEPLLSSQRYLIR